MNKYLIVGDIHWSQYSSIVRRRGSNFSIRLEKLIESMNWVEQFAKEQCCCKEIFCGDFFDRPDMNAEEITAIQEVKWNDLEKVFLVGNHESNVASLEFSSAKIFESIDANVVSEAYSEDINDKVSFNYIPYITCDGTVPLSSYIANKTKKNVVFAHQDIAGIQYGKFVSQSGFDINDIKKNCSLFIDGHLHNEAQFENIVLVGNLCGANFNEDLFTYDHLVYVLTIDDDKITMEPFVNPYAMNFGKVKIETEKDLSKLDNLKANPVLSIVCDSKLKDKVEAKIKDKVLDYRLTVFYTATTSEGEIGSYNFKVDDHIEQFINFARQKFEPSPILEDELVRLRA